MKKDVVQIFQVNDCVVRKTTRSAYVQLSIEGDRLDMVCRFEFKKRTAQGQLIHRDGAYHGVFEQLLETGFEAERIL